MLKFSNLYMFWFMFGVLLLLGLVILRYVWKRKKLRKYFAKDNLDTLMPELSFRRWMLRYLLVSFIFLLMVLTLARPKFGPKVRMTKSNGMDIVLAIDVSNSMLAEDLQPNRLERTKDAIAAFLEKLKGDRVGLVAFAGAADLVVELTNDYAAIKNVLPGIQPGMFGTQGTSISEAIRVSLLAFPENMKNAGAIILLTDGEDHEGELDKMINKANKQGINIFTIGIGSQQGAKIPLYDDQGNLKGYKKDNQDKEVITRANPVLLQDIAKKGKGDYYSGEDPLTALISINQTLRKLEKEVYENKSEEGLNDQYQWILIFVIILLALEIIFAERKGRWLKKIDL